MNQSIEPLDFADRYGRKRSKARFIGYALFLAFIGWLFWSASHHANPEISAKLVSFKSIDEKTMSITFELVRNKPDRQIDCILTAVDIDKFIVGEINYRVAAGKSRELVTTEIPTRARSVSASVVRCTATN